MTVQHLRPVPDGETPENTQAETMLLKRSVTVKTVVTDDFREKAKTELADELGLIDKQLEQLDTQYQQTLQQLEQFAQQGRNVNKEMEQLNLDANQRRQQLAKLKLEVSSKLANLDKVPNGSFIVTGMLENFVELKVGDNIYDKLRKAEVIVEDGVVSSIVQ